MHRPGSLCVFFLAVLLLGGCIGTPLQELRWSGARIVPLEPDEPSPVRVLMRGWRFNDFELHMVSALCGNHSQKYSSLRELDLSHSRVTGAGLESCMVLNSSHFQDLRVLNLTGCEVSEETMAKVRDALHPECRIIR